MTWKGVLIPALLLASLFALPAAAQDVFVRNRPYEGPRQGQGAGLMVGLKEIAALFDLEVEEVEGRFCVGEGPAEGAQPGEVWVAGTKVGSTPGADGPLVNLKEFAEAAELSYNYNKGLNTIDVTAARKKVPAAAGAPADQTVDKNGAILVNQKTPGASFDLNTLIQPGKITVLLLYTLQVKDEGYRKTFTAVDAFTQFPDVTVVKVNMGDRERSPLAKRYPGMVPRVIVLNRARVAVETWNGHSILDKSRNPESTIAAVRAR